MTSERIFLGWDGPVLPRAAEALAKRFMNDFDGVLIALPGARAGRRLEEVLIEECGPAWIPPRIQTIGPITDALVRFPRARAGNLARELAWVKALQDVPEAALAAITKRRPEAADFSGWASLAGQVRGLHQELAAERRRFAEVVPCALLPARERERWRALAAVQERYAALIAECGLGDPHLERLRALENDAPLRVPRALVLVGVAAVNGLQEDLLRRAAAQGAQVLAMIAAPEAEAAAFDELGLARTEAWKERAVPLDDARWRVADRPADQAEEAAAFLRAACGGTPDARASVAVLQPEVTPFLARRLSELGAGLRPSVGRSIAESAPGRLLEALRAFLEGRTPSAFAALLRHPDLAALLGGGGDVGAACDEFLAEHLPARVDGRWPDFKRESRAAGGEPQEPGYLVRLKIALRELERLGGALFGEAPQPLAAWPREVGRLMKDVFSQRLGREDAEAVERIASALEEVAHLPPVLAAERLSGADFLRLVMHACGHDTIAPDPSLDGLEQLGWLELPLDEAPALCVAGFQLGAAPEAVHGHPFLPEALRVALGLPSNADRRARDVAAIHVLAHAREALLFISGQRGTAGDPWLPSPLVFQGADAAARVHAFFRAPQSRATTSGGTTTAWTPPLPPPASKGVPTKEERPFSASRLNLYLRSPRLYWLQRELGLESVEAEPHEMDALVFGTFTHGVLAQFHREEAHAKLRSAEALAGAVLRVLRATAEARFGARPLAAVRLQLAQLEARLAAWAEHEAASRAEGWRTIAVEWDAEPLACVLDEERFRLHGRIDRVDRREDASGVELRVLDYKTGERASVPGKAFKPTVQRWEDLQLPIYRKLAASLAPEAAAIRLGWFNLPRGVEESGVVLADWDEKAFALADQAIVSAVRGIRAGEFTELGRVDRRQLSPAMATLLGVAQADDEDDEEEESEA